MGLKRTILFLSTILFLRLIVAFCFILLDYWLSL